MTSILKAIGPQTLTAYFELLDDMLAADKFRGTQGGAARILQERHPGMCRTEARVIARAWDKTWSASQPAEDRADAALEVEAA